VLAWLSAWSEVQTCIWPSWCHCHSLSLASVKSRLVLPLVPAHAHLGSPGQRAVTRVCVCVPCRNWKSSGHTRTCLAVLWRSCHTAAAWSWFRSWTFLASSSCVYVLCSSRLFQHWGWLLYCRIAREVDTHTHNRLMAFDWDYPGRPVRFTHSHPSRSSDILYQLPPSTTFRSILLI